VDRRQGKTKGNCGEEKLIYADLWMFKRRRPHGGPDMQLYTEKKEIKNRNRNGNGKGNGMKMGMKMAMEISIRTVSRWMQYVKIG